MTRTYSFEVDLVHFNSYLGVIKGYIRTSKAKSAPLPLNVSDAIHAVVRYGSVIYNDGGGKYLKLTEKEKEKEVILRYYYSKSKPEDIPLWVRLKTTTTRTGKNRSIKAK